MTDYEKMRKAIAPQTAEKWPPDYGTANGFAFIPMRQGTVKGIGANSGNKGKPVTIGSIKTRAEYLEGFFHDEDFHGDGYGEIYNIRLYQIIFFILAIGALFVNVYLAGLFAAIFGWHTGHWNWVHFLSVLNNKGRNIMYTC